MPDRIQHQVKQQKSFPTVEEEVFVGLQIVADRLMQPWAARLKATAGLTPVQYNVLRILRGAGADGLWAGEIGSRLITRNPDVTRLVDRLVARGLAFRSTDPSDRRAVRVHISQEGLDRLAPLDAPGRRLLVEGFRGLGSDRLVDLRDTLDAMLEILDQVAPDGMLVDSDTSQT